MESAKEAVVEDDLSPALQPTTPCYRRARKPQLLWRNLLFPFTNGILRSSWARSMAVRHRGQPAAALGTYIITFAISPAGAGYTKFRRNRTVGNLPH